MINEKCLQLISLDGKVAMITGAAPGIGMGTAKKLAEFGASIVLLDINEENVLKNWKSFMNIKNMKTSGAVYV